MTDVPYVNSDGLARIMELNGAAKSGDSTLVLVSPTPFVRDVLQTTGLDRLMPVADSLDGAVSALAGE